MSKNNIYYIIYSKNSKQFRLTKKGNNVDVFNKIIPQQDQNINLNQNQNDYIRDENFNLNE